MLNGAFIHFCIVVWRKVYKKYVPMHCSPDANRWNLDRLKEIAKEEDITLAEQGLTDWAAKLDEEDRT